MNANSYFVPGQPKGYFNYYTGYKYKCCIVSLPHIKCSNRFILFYAVTHELQ